LQGSIEAIGHRRFQRMSVAADALRDRASNLRIAPTAEAARWMRGDVGSNAGWAVGHTLAQREGAAALAEPASVVLHAARPGGVALHAMADGGEIGAVLCRIGHHRCGEAGLSIGIGLAVNREPVDRLRHFVAN